MADDLAFLNESEPALITLKLALFRQRSRLGRQPEALTVWSDLAHCNLNLTSFAIAAHHYALHLFNCGELNNEELVKAEELNCSAKSALGNRNLCALRGFWSLESKEYEPAKKCLRDAVTHAHKAGKVDRRSEICLAIAKYYLHELPDPKHIAEQFTYDLDDSCHQALADLWFAIGDRQKAKKHALAAYRWAWADGEPYVRRYELNRSHALLEKLGTLPPKLPPYDPGRDQPLPWEGKVAAAIEELRSEKEAIKPKR